MALKAQLDNDIKAALLSGDRFTADVLRGLKAVILNEEVARGVRDTGLADTAIEQLIAKEVKKRADSVTQYSNAGRPELADLEAKERILLEAYLPEQVSEAELSKTIQEIIAKLGATSPQAMGQVIGAVKARFGTSADGALVARLVKEALQSE